jgi:hypothetical protein
MAPSIRRKLEGMLGLRRYGNGWLSVAGARLGPCQYVVQAATGPPGWTVRTASLLSPDCPG